MFSIPYTSFNYPLIKHIPVLLSLQFSISHKQWWCTLHHSMVVQLILWLHLMTVIAGMYRYNCVSLAVQIYDYVYNNRTTENVFNLLCPAVRILCSFFTIMFACVCREGIALEKFGELLYFRNSLLIWLHCNNILGLCSSSAFILGAFTRRPSSRYTLLYSSSESLLYWWLVDSLAVFIVKSINIIYVGLPNIYE